MDIVANMHVQKIGKKNFRITFAASRSRCLPNLASSPTPQKKSFVPSRRRPTKFEKSSPNLLSHKSWQNESQEVQAAKQVVQTWLTHRKLGSSDVLTSAATIQHQQASSSRDIASYTRKHSLYNWFTTVCFTREP
jgi:hypothetical protein